MNTKRVIAFILAIVLVCGTLVYADTNTGGGSSGGAGSAISGGDLSRMSVGTEGGIKLSLGWVPLDGYDAGRLGDKTPMSTSLSGSQNILEASNLTDSTMLTTIAPIYFSAGSLDDEIYYLDNGTSIHTDNISNYIINSAPSGLSAEEQEAYNIMEDNFKILWYNEVEADLLSHFGIKQTADLTSLDEVAENNAKKQVVVDTIIKLMADKYTTGTTGNLLSDLVDDINAGSGFDKDYFILIEPVVGYGNTSGEGGLITPNTMVNSFAGGSIINSFNVLEHQSVIKNTGVFKGVAYLVGALTNIDFNLGPSSGGDSVASKIWYTGPVVKSGGVVSATKTDDMKVGYGTLFANELSSTGEPSQLYINMINLAEK